MRRVLFPILWTAATVTWAQQPPKLEPLPEAPPPPVVRDPADDPRVRIAPQEGDRVEEVRDNGRVVMLKVTPPNGIPYYLLDPTGEGSSVRSQTDTGLRVPMWTILNFD